MVKKLGCYSILALAGMVFAASPQTHKNYDLKNLSSVTGDPAECASLYASLQDLAKTPLSLQFFESTDMPTSETKANFEVQDSQDQLMNHHYSIVSQTIEGSYVHRVGSGSFMLQGNEFHYVVDISADTANAQFKYSYPVLISADKGECGFVGVIEPDTDTVSSFKSNLTTGVVAKKKDLLTPAA